MKPLASLLNGLKACLGKINMKRLSPEQWKKFGKNMLMFSAPSLAVFFGQLSQGVEFKYAFPVAVLTFWGLVADYFSKMNK